MKEKMQKEVIKIGTKHVDQGNLNTIEAISMSIVAILSLMAGTVYGDILF